MESNGILTLAFGKSEYIEMAKSLARSLAMHAPSVPRAVVTDTADPELESLFTHTIKYRSEYGSNVRQKMYIDQYSPFEKTIFIDSDSLAVSDLTNFWNAFRNAPFGVCGVRTLHAGERDEYLDVEYILNKFNLTGLPKFNGGTYYFDRSPESKKFFSTARDLLKRSAELRFSEFRTDGPADEALYSVAMALHGLTVTDMGLGGMWTPIDATSSVVVDIPKGICHFTKRGRDLKPDIIHFATFTDSFIYRRECLKLRRLEQDGEDLIPASENIKLRAIAASRWVPKKFRGLRRRLKRWAGVK